MTKIPRKKVEELLKQVGFSEREIERIYLSSVCPLALKISSHSMQEIAKMWGDIFDGKGTAIKEVNTAHYQCLLFGEAIGVTIITSEPDLNNPGDWKKEIIVEVAVYKKVPGVLTKKWEKITIIPKEGGQTPTLELEVNRVFSVVKVAKFIELLQDNM
ncbi:MAG: hypothetical protein Q7R84_02590 [bacterium]|nr:hypothetical protein [bacterium]